MDATVIKSDNSTLGDIMLRALTYCERTQTSLEDLLCFALRDKLFFDDIGLVLSPAALLALRSCNLADLAVQHFEDGQVFVGVTEYSYKAKYRSALDELLFHKSLSD